jgi:hypothetical protein
MTTLAIIVGLIPTVLGVGIGGARRSRSRSSARSHFACFVTLLPAAPPQARRALAWSTLSNQGGSEKAPDGFELKACEKRCRKLAGLVDPAPLRSSQQ